jgi:hypothetical protein
MNRTEAEASVPLKLKSFSPKVSWPRGQDYQARPCLDLRLDDVESSSLVFCARHAEQDAKENPLARNKGKPRFDSAALASSRCHAVHLRPRNPWALS